MTIQTQRMDVTLADVLRSSKSDSRPEISTTIVGLAILSHIALGALIYASPGFAALHLVVVLLMVVWAAISKMPLHKVIYVLAYLATSEVIWRMNGVNPIWETGKYVTVAIIVLALFRSRSTAIPILAFIYILFLVPSSFVTVGYFGGIFAAKGALSFNLSGPIALFCCIWLAHQVTFTRYRLAVLMLILTMPVVTLATHLLIVVSTIDITWVTESNFAASGGYGPNQVSATIGAGLFAVMLLLLLLRLSFRTRILLIALGIWFAAQGMLTFSRGGVINGLVPVLLGTIYLLIRGERLAFKRLVPLILGGAIFVTSILPAVDTLTEGTLVQRFSDTDPSGRTEIALANYEAFLRYPVLGVGPGLSRTISQVVAHTEFTRLLAEHGSFGVMSLVILFIMPLTRMLKYRSNPMIVAAIIMFVVWALIFMSHSAMRLVAPALMYGLAMANFEIDPDPHTPAGPV